MENLIQYIKPELLVLPLLLGGLGVLLKRSKLKDNYIPVVLGVIGILVGSIYCVTLEGFTFVSIGMGIIQGLLCTATSTYTHQIIKQMMKLGVKNADFVKDVVEALEDKS